MSQISSDGQYFNYVRLDDGTIILNDGMNEVARFTFIEGQLQLLDLKQYSFDHVYAESVMEFSYSENSQLSRITEDGKVADVYWNFQGDIIRIETDRVTYTFEYDNKRNPFYQLPVPADYSPTNGFGFAINYFCLHNVTDYKWTYRSEDREPFDGHIEYDYISGLPKKTEWTATDSLSDNILHGAGCEFRYEKVIGE